MFSTATYTYSMKMALSRYGHERLFYQDAFADQNTKEFQDLAFAAHEGINRMVMQSDLRDVYHGVHINGFQPVKIPTPEGVNMNGVLNDFYVQVFILLLYFKAFFTAFKRIASYLFC